MANRLHIALVLLISIAIVVALGMWLEWKNGAEPELLLPEGAEFNGPLAPEELKIANPGITNDMNRIATFTTNKGVIELELFESEMPITTGNFIKLAEEGFYNDTKFHRVIDGFMIQGGDPNSKGGDRSRYGTGGPGYTIKDEFIAGELLTNTRGTIAMANTGQPDSGGSQFFINLVDNTGLDYDKEPFESKHPVFGRVISGMDIVDAIANEATDPGNAPINPVVIESIAIRAQ